MDERGGKEDHIEHCDGEDRKYGMKAEQVENEEDWIGREWYAGRSEQRARDRNKLNKSITLFDTNLLAEVLQFNSPPAP